MDKENINKNFKYYHYLFNIIQAGINIVDKDGRIIYVNDAYCKMHNYTKEELIGKSLELILPEQKYLEGLKNYKKIINKEITPPYIIESFNIRRDGSSFPVLI